jgi:cell division protein FtsZ
VQVIAINTDAMALERTTADEKVLIGRTLMNGRGSRGNPELGRQAALRDLETIAPLLKGAGTVVVVAGLGGGTGSGAISPIVRLARKMGAFVPVVVTRPFNFEGERRAVVANHAIDVLEQHVNTAVVIPCEGVMDLVTDSHRSFAEAFTAVDKMVLHAIKVFREASQGGATGISREDLKNLFSSGMGRTVMGVGSGRGYKQGAIAGFIASHSSVIDRGSIRGARSVYVHVEGGDSMKLHDVNDALFEIMRMASPAAIVRFGISHDPDLEDSVAVTVLATGFPGRRQAAAKELENVRYEDEPWSEKV